MTKFIHQFMVFKKTLTALYLLAYSDIVSKIAITATIAFKSYLVTESL